MKNTEFNPIVVPGEYRKLRKHDPMYEVYVSYEYVEELLKRGCVHSSALGWTPAEALHNLNKTLATVNVQVPKVTKSIFSK